MAGNTLRRVCREGNAVERCITLFEKLAEGHPNVVAVRINAALAYVDELPNHSLYTQAKLSTHSIQHVSAILETDPDNWLALYIRGLNNLYWPLWYRRTDRAIADLTRCIRLSEGMSAARRRPYMALAYVALGDTYARLSRIDDALAAWKRGARLYQSPQLQDRLQAEPRTLHEMIEKIRSRDVPIDTDLSVFSVDLMAAGS
jgi:tetratricopeptide (TPR) repeat protein